MCGQNANNTTVPGIVARTFFYTRNTNNRVVCVIHTHWTTSASQ